MVSLRYDDDLICIGSGSIDQYAAIQAAILGKRAVLGERRKTVGGVCVESGTILGKTFREAVLSFNSMTRHFEGHERYRYQRRAIAVQLLARVEAVMRRDVDVVVGQMRRNDVTLFHSDASFNDPSIVMVTTEDGNRSITAANILIAVEARPCVGGRRHLRRRNDSSSGDVPRLNQLPRHMALLGGGIIGVGYVSMFAALDSNITVLDKRTRLLEFLDSKIVEELIHQMRSRYDTFLLGETVERLEIISGMPRRVVLTLESGKRVVSDSILYAADRTGATECLNLPATGFTADKRGHLRVDAQFRIEVSHIFVVGDVAGYPGLASTSA